MRRRAFLRTGASLAISCGVGACVAKAEGEGTSNQKKGNFGAELERLVPELMKEVAVPGVSIAIVEDGKLSWSGGFGVKSADTKEPVDERTLFQSASISKTVFAYAVLKLSERPELFRERAFDLDTPLTRYVPWRFLEGDARLEEITARHALSHSGGFHDWRSGENPLKIHFAPGKGFAYSGEGYYYLQSVVTDLLGRTDRTQCAQYESGVEVCASDFDAFMTRRVLQPFGMNESCYEWREGSAEQIAHGHDGDGKVSRSTKPRGSDVARYGSAGGLLTTAKEYAKFMMELVAPKPADEFRLSASLRREMMRPYIKLPADQLIDGATSWALGWAVQERKDGNYLVHSGGQSGFRSLAMISPEKRTGFVILTNSDNGGKLIYRQSMMELLNRVLTASG